MAPAFPIGFTGQRESKNCAIKGSGELMGKSRKVSKGYGAPGIEVKAQSEGFRSSGRVDTERAASEDFCAPRRKCISLNSDQFGVPIQVTSLSNLSRSERKDLEIRLRNELEQVRILNKKIASFSCNGRVIPPDSNIHSRSNGQRKPGVDIPQRPLTEATVHTEKKKAAPVRNGPRTKGQGARLPEPVKQTVASNTSIVMFMKQCETLLNRMMSHNYGPIFNVPVDVVALKIPDYFTVIKHPMDLGTIKSKLGSGEYFSPLDFAADVRLTFKNAMTYNPPANTVHMMAQTLSKYFEVRWKPIEKKIPVNEEKPLPSKPSVIIEKPFPSKPSVIIETETPLPMPPAKKRKVAPLENMVKPKMVKRVMSSAEKQKLSNDLVVEDLPINIYDFLKDNGYKGSQINEDEIEIDIDAISDDILFKLRKVLDDCILEKQKSQAKAEPCEMELHNESGFSNSSLQPGKGNEADEDVDIGGDDPPVTSFPPVEIEKDSARRNSKSSSSRSSSSDSGSSSSDTDSGSSSGAESDGAKDSVPIAAQKATLASGVTLEIEDELGHLKARDSSDGPTELNSQQKSVSAEPDHREGENAPPERQGSPEKLYRAALLRSRFADTILKAQEKSLEKGEVRDPEKLKLEREELERRRREEKARLQAEAKAAEEARRKAKAEAVAEAKRQRELEREAARQALQKMEKTVEINENGRFLEDLELFRAAPDEQLESFIEETSPGDSQNGLGSFNFRGSSNPLEQLGLFMKEEEEEEEEDDEPQCVPDAPNDPEEGEID